MELNFDFVRDLLIFCAKSPNPHGPRDTDMRKFAKSKGFSVDDLAFTINRLYEAEYITKKTVYGSGVPITMEPGNLTWNGNEYLNSVRSPSVWKATKDKISGVGGKLTFQLVTSVATSIVKSQLGLS